MKKIILFFIMLFCFNGVNASSGVGAKIGNIYYDTLEDAINASSSKDTITLTGNTVLDETLEINKTVNINLNNYNIEAKNKVFIVHGGSLNLSGKGKIIETEPYYGAITLTGSDSKDDKDFTTISVGKDITLVGWSGIFINHINNTAYGILVNMDGTINAVNDIDNGTGIGIYTNGNIKNLDSAPIINLSNTTKITSTGNGIYSAGYATYNINGAYIEGVESGLGIKSGKFNINDATIIGSGSDKTPTSGNNNGINASGTAIQIESNIGYKGNIELNIKDGNFTSKNSYVIYEYVVNGNDTKMSDINISGGKFVSNADKDVINVSNYLKSKHSKFISGGLYSSDVSSFLKDGFTLEKNNDLYEVITNTISTFKEEENSKKTVIPIILSILFISSIGIFIYIKKKH